MYSLSEATSPTFARHETFHPRYGWFRKAVAAAATHTDAFNREDATVELGVGKNMVRAIRFWGRAAKLLAEAPNPERPRQPRVVPSHRGLAIFDAKGGADPYLELPGSLWLLHWWMLSRKSLLPVWWLAFNQFTPIEFTAEDLVNFAWEHIQRQSSWQLPVRPSVEKDVTCLIRTYAASAGGRLLVDDFIDCPFRELGLLEQVWDDKRRFRFVLGPKPTLPVEVVGLACLEYMADIDPNLRSMMLSHLAHGQGSPGRAFKLPETVLLEALEHLSASDADIQIVASAGSPQFTVRAEPRSAAIDILWSYYAKAGRTVTRPTDLGDGAADAPTPLFDDEAPMPTTREQQLTARP